MNMEKMLEFGGVIIVGFLLLRWISNAFATNQDSGLTQTWQPSVYPYQYGGGVLTFQPSVVAGPFYPNTYRGQLSRQHRGR
jgi:hypothetical protein